jgi:hypothetical protein
VNAAPAAAVALALALAGTLSLSLAACAPATWSYLTVPLDCSECTARSPVRVAVPLAELAARWPALDPDVLAFYDRGRTPRPFALLDADGDGAVDTALVELSLEPPVEALVVTCPGPRFRGDAPAGEPTPGIALDFRNARQ